MNKWLVYLFLLAAVGCGPKRTLQQAVQALDASSVDERVDGARDVEGYARRDRGLPPDVTDALLEKFPTESDAKTKAAMITALGYTGDARVKPLLDAYLQTTDASQQRWAARAYKKYVVKTGEYPESHEFPENWPYGTPGFPAPAGD